MTTFTIDLNSGLKGVNALVLQGVADLLRNLAKIDNVYPTVQVWGGGWSAGIDNYVQMVQIIYPTHIEGHRYVDGVACDAVIPIAIPQVLQQGPAMADKLNRQLALGGDWQTEVAAAINAGLAPGDSIDPAVTPVFTKAFLMKPAGCGSC